MLHRKYVKEIFKITLQLVQILGFLLTIYSAFVLSPLSLKLIGMTLGSLFVVLMGKWGETLELNLLYSRSLEEAISPEKNVKKDRREGDS